MKRVWKRTLAKALSCGMLLSGIPATAAFAAGIDKPEGHVTPFEKYGTVQVAEDAETGYQQLSDEDGNPVQLKGMSSFGLQWGDGNWILNDAAFDALAYDWKCDIIRLAMYVTEGGYASDPAAGLARVEKGIQLATERGMYVLVDWHMLSPGNPSDPQYLEAGVDLPEYASIRAAHPEYNGPQLFFAYISEKYGAQGNVLFETANEPNGNGGEKNAEETWTNKLLPYHQSMVDAIREYDADDTPNVVICGTDNWSQFVNAPLASPVVDPAVEAGDADVNQIMYTFHFYAGTHDTKIDEEKGDYWLGMKIKEALEGGIGVFCTEWGTSESTGDGGPYINYAERWLDFLEEYKISWCSWSLALKNEISAAMQGGATKEPTDLDGDGIPNWNYATDDTNKDLSISGNYVRAKIRGEEAPMYGASELITDFEDGLPMAIVLGDSPVSAEDYPLSVEATGATKALKLDAAAGGIWGGPRISFQSLGNVYSLFSDISFDVYIEDTEDLVAGKLEIQPIIQTEALGWWGQIGQITLTADDFEEDEETGMLKATAKANFDDKKVGGDKLGHLTFLIGDTAGFYMDNLALETWYNGDIADAPVIPDEPGTFIEVPYTFEAGQREGWKPEGASTIDYMTIAIEEVGEGDHAMSFPVKLEAGKNEWEDGVRLSSSMGIFKLDECKTFADFVMDVYLEKGKATEGLIKIAVCPTPNGDGYWYQSGEVTVDPVNGGEAVTAPGGRELLKYTVTVPLNKDPDAYGVYPFSEKVAIRNIILALHNDDSDYEGRVYYDNIRFEALPEVYSQEWVDGIWYEKDGSQTYEGIGAWKKESKGWTFGDSLGWKAKNRWQKIDGKWYFFDKDGIMESDAYRKGYYLKKDGSWDEKDAAPGWKKNGKGWWMYWTTVKTFIKDGWKKIDGKWYYFRGNYIGQNEFVQGWWLGANGAMTDFAKCSWHKTGKGWWYGNSSWYAKTSYMIDGTTCNFGKDGYYIEGK